MPLPRVFLADDHQLLLEAFSKFLEGKCRIVGTARDGAELLERAPQTRPEVVVVDVNMPNLDGIEAARELKEKIPGVQIVFLTMNADVDTAARAIDAGCSGYVLKSGGGKELLNAISKASVGRSYIAPEIAVAVARRKTIGDERAPELTDRQRQVLALLAGGRSMKQVGYTLGITRRTVAHHKYLMMETLGFENSAELICYAARQGLGE
jgi:DNA-binding NarL/FixJ family response regulator